MLEITKERVDMDFLLATLDFSALQTRLALIDTCLNPKGMEPSLWKVYNPDSTMDDLHSLTGFSVFVDSVKKKVIEIDTGDKKITLFPTEKIKVNRNGKEMELLGSEILPTDDWIGFA
jgi:hypothetical protein